jgi:hypothetical protein
MHTDRKTAGAGVDVVAGERALAPHIKLAAGVQSQKMRRDRRAPLEECQNAGRPIRTRQCHRRLSKATGGISAPAVAGVNIIATVRPGIVMAAEIPAAH